MGGTALGASGRSNNGLKLDVKTGKLSLWRLFPTFTFYPPIPASMCRGPFPKALVLSLQRIETWGGVAGRRSLLPPSDLRSGRPLLLLPPCAGRPAVPPSFRSLRACRSGRHAPTLPPVTRRCLRFCACPILPLPGLPACRLHLCGPRPPAWPLSQLLCRGGWARFLVVVVCGSSTCPSPPLVCLPPLGWPSGAPRLPPRPLPRLRKAFFEGAGASV